MVQSRDAFISKPKLLHLVFGAERGGVEGNARGIVSNLPEMSHQVLVFGNRGPMIEDWESAGAIVEVLGSRAARPFTISKYLHNFLHETPHAGAIAWFGLVQLPQIIRCCNQAKVPLVVHGGNPAHTMSRWVDLRYQLMSWIWSSAGRLPTYVCCSQYVADSFDSSYYLRTFPRSVVYNGVELPTIPTHQPKPFNPNVPFVIGMTARLSQIKDHETLLRAFQRVTRVHENIRLELAGDGELRASLETLAVKLNIADRVNFLGNVSDIYSVLARWDLFAYSTTEREGLGNAVSEALMFGLPCVVTDVGPMREFKGQSENIRFVPPKNPKPFAEAILDLIEDFSARQRLSMAGKEFASKVFHPITYSRGYLELLMQQHPSLNEGVASIV